VVIVGSLLPSSAKTHLHASGTKQAHSINKIGVAHRLIHLFAFGSSFFVLAFLANGRREQLQAAAEVMTIGCAVELIQYFVYSHRQVFEWWDIRDDALGIAVAFLLVEIAGRVNGAVASRT
jgi:hypothetical protein